METASAPPIYPPLPPTEDESSDDTIRPADYNNVKNEGDYLKLVNDLKKQFDEYKSRTDREIRFLKIRIGKLVDANTNFDFQNLKLKNMYLKLSEVHFKATIPYR